MSRLLINDFCFRAFLLLVGTLSSEVRLNKSLVLGISTASLINNLYQYLQIIIKYCAFVLLNEDFNSDISDLSMLFFDGIQLREH